MQDGAPSHKAEETQNLIRDNVPEFIEVDISPQRNNGEWSLNSPDLNVMDYSMWSILEAEACSKPHQLIDALKKSLVKAWNAIPQEVIGRAVDDFPKRLKNCIEAGEMVSTSAEILYNIFLALDRNEVEKCQLVSCKWRDVVNSNSTILPLRKLQIEEISLPDNVHISCPLKSENERQLSPPVAKKRPKLEINDDEKRIRILRLDHLNPISAPYLKSIQYGIFDFYEVEENFDSQQLALWEKLAKFCGKKIRIVKLSAGIPNFENAHYQALKTLLSNFIEASAVKFWTWDDGAIKNPSILQIPSPPNEIGLLFNNFESTATLDELINFIKLAKLDTDRDYHMWLSFVHLPSEDFIEEFCKKWIEIFEQDKILDKYMHHIVFNDFKWDENGVFHYANTSEMI
uniref:F-box domain-containing protein n=1 Tax=Acrobeloides nanus TaxID=290746 RepID=A0A914EK04_9BILA